MMATFIDMFPIKLLSLILSMEGIAEIISLESVLDFCNSFTIFWFSNSFEMTQGQILHLEVQVYNYVCFKPLIEDGQNLC